MPHLGWSCQGLRKIVCIGIEQPSPAWAVGLESAPRFCNRCLEAIFGGTHWGAIYVRFWNAYKNPVLRPGSYVVTQEHVVK